MLDFNILPPEEKKRVRVLRWSKIITLWGTACTVVVVGFLFLLLPSYLIVAFQKTDVSRNLSITENNPLTARILSLRMLVASLKKYAFDIKKVSEASGLFSSLVSRVDSLLPADVSLTVFRYTAADATVSIQGIAGSRTSLAGFEQALKNDGRFDNVSLPLSSLVMTENIPFTITATYHDQP